MIWGLNLNNLHLDNYGHIDYLLKLTDIVLLVMVLVITVDAIIELWTVSVFSKYSWHLNFDW